MAVVTINNEVKQSFLIAGSAKTVLPTATFVIRSSTPITVRFTINGGAPTIHGPSTSINLGFPVPIANELQDLEIEVINGGSLTDITELKALGTTYFTTTIQNLGSKLPNLIELEMLRSSFDASFSDLSGNIRDLPPNLERIIFSGSATGLISDLPSSLTTFSYFGGSATISGTFADLPVNLEYLTCTQALNLGGNSSDFPSTLISISGAYGQVLDLVTTDFPSTLRFINIANSGSAGINISGSIASLPANMTTLRIATTDGINNTLSGNIDDLPSSLATFYIASFSNDTNTIAGDIGNIPTGLQTLIVEGNNTISGDIGNIPSNACNTLRIEGLNTITGTIQSFGGITGLCVIEGNNTISGNLGSITDAFNLLIINGNNTINGFQNPPLSDVVSQTSGSFDFIIGGDAALSSTDVDNIMIHFDSILPIASGAGKDIILNGSATGAPTSASEPARLSLASKGYNVITN